MTGVELFLAGVAVLAVLSVLLKARAGIKRARAAVEIARAGTHPVSLLGRVLVTAAGIVAVQWAVITYATDQAWVWVALSIPALVCSHTVTQALTVVTINPSRRRAGDRR